MRLLKFILGPMGTNCYFIIDEESCECAVVDPAYNADFILEKLKENGARLKYIILTHAHFDHLLGLEKLRDITKAPLCIHEDDNPSLPDPDKTCMTFFAGKDDKIREAEILLHDGDCLYLGNEKLNIIHTPGHTMGSICISFYNSLITGDTLFREEIGRYDLYGGNFTKLCESVKKLSSFPDSCRIYPGHGMSSTMEHEKKYNLYLM